ncbi:MAG: amidohydrolase [Deltaproteobacteria bacterium]|nr:amidohydrolase [Deltaproteobacteria bacterium]
MTLIDVHTHLFNHAHLPVEAIGRRFLLYSLHTDPIVAAAGGRAFAKLVDQIAVLNEDPSHAQLIDALIKAKTWSQVQRALLLLTPHRRSPALREAIELYGAQRPQGDEPADDREKPPKPCSQDGNIERFLLLMTLQSGAMPRRLLAEYGPQRVPALIVHLMMDMDEGYRCDGAMPETALTPKQRVDELVEMGLAYKGRLAGFVPFDPRRPDALELVHYGLARGMVGVKVYPPMGYYPADSRYSARLNALYAYCEQEGVPVVSHTSPCGFEALPSYGLYAAPEGWRAVLKDYPKLRLCLAHAGSGDHRNYPSIQDNPAKPTEHPVHYPGWYNAAKDWDAQVYARQVLELCADFDNVYTDLSYLTQLSEEGTKRDTLRKTMRDNLVYLFKDPRLGRVMQTRLMFGSDWHMPAAVGHAASNLKVFEDMFEHQALSPFRDAFFGGNALRFLNLNEVRGRVQRTGDAMDEMLTYWEGLKP